MHPREKALLCVRLDPLDRFTRCNVASALNRVENPGIVFTDVELIRVEIEPALEARLTREDDRADERVCGRSWRLRRFCKSWNAGRQRRRDIVANRVLSGVPSGEDGDVRRSRQRDMNGRMQRDGAFGSQ